MRIHLGVVALLGSLSCLSLGCRPYVVPLEVKVLPRANPTEYEFEADSADVIRCIETHATDAFSKPIMVLSVSGTPWLRYSSPPEPSYGTWTPPPSDDSSAQSITVLLESLTALGRSPVYSVKGKPVPYLSSFLLRVCETSTGTTRVEVECVRPQVIVGKTSGFMNPHGPANIYQAAEPTTIEEYRILLAIGACLGVDGMPELVVPEQPGLLLPTAHPR